LGLFKFKPKPKKIDEIKTLLKRPLSFDMAKGALKLMRQM
jgi:hypothetical protein